MADLLVVQSKVKELISKGGFRTSEEAVHALDAAVRECINKAQKRCKDEGMGTIKARHI